MNIAAYEDRKRYRQGCLPGALGAVPMLIAYAGMLLFFGAGAFAVLTRKTTLPRRQKMKEGIVNE